MRPSGATVQQPEAGLPLPLALVSFIDPVLGEPIAFAQCALIPGSDTPLTLPVYTMPSGLEYMPGQSSVQTVLASGTSPRPEGWSSDVAQIADITREGPFDAFASPMDTEDSPLVTDMNLGYESGIWFATPSSAVPGIHRCAGVGSAVVPFTNVLGGSARRGAGYGGSSQLAERRWHYVVKSSDSFAVHYVAA